MRTRIALACALTLLAASPASGQIRKFGNWIAACDNQRNCAPSADATLTLAIATEQPVRFKIVAAGDRGLFPPGEISGLPVESDRHIRLSVEATATKITAWVRKTQRLEVLQFDPPLISPDDRKLDGIPFTGAIAALAWIDERQLRSGSETAFVKRGKKSVALLLPQQPAPPVVTAAKPGDEPVPTQHPPEVRARANSTCGKVSIDADPVKTVRLAADQLMCWFFCGQYSGAAGLNHAFLLMPDGKPQAAVKPRFALPPQVGRYITLGQLKIPTNKDAVFNSEFDPATLMLTSFSS